MALAKMGAPEEAIPLIKLFHQHMKAKIRLERKTVGEIKVKKWAQTGLLQGTCSVQSLYLLGTGDMAGES